MRTASHSAYFLETRHSQRKTGNPYYDTGVRTAIRTPGFLLTMTDSVTGKRMRYDSPVKVRYDTDLIRGRPQVPWPKVCLRQQNFFPWIGCKMVKGTGAQTRGPIRN